MIENAHILVVEDENHLAVGIKYNLEAEGYRVTVAQDGHDALRLFESPHDFSLVILDIMLPGMSGYSVCEAIRERGNQVPVLMLSARTLPEDRARGFDVGANQYLSKPFELDELLSRVNNLLKLAAPSSSRPPKQESVGGVFRFGNASVNFDTFEATVQGKPVRMTKLEMDLLRYFIQHQGRIVSREELLTEVWKMPPHLNTRAPDQFIRRLRKAFEQDPSRPKHFVTIREAGYRFLANGLPDGDGQAEPASG